MPTKTRKPRTQEAAAKAPLPKIPDPTTERFEPFASWHIRDLADLYLSSSERSMKLMQAIERAEDLGLPHVELTAWLEETQQALEVAEELLAEAVILATNARNRGRNGDPYDRCSVQTMRTHGGVMVTVSPGRVEREGHPPQVNYERHQAIVCVTPVNDPLCHLELGDGIDRERGQA